MALEDCGSGSTTKIKGIKNSTKRESLFFMRFKRVKNICQVPALDDTL